MMQVEHSAQCLYSRRSSRNTLPTTERMQKTYSPWVFSLGPRGLEPGLGVWSHMDESIKLTWTVQVDLEVVRKEEQ